MKGKVLVNMGVEFEGYTYLIENFNKYGFDVDKGNLKKTDDTDTIIRGFKGYDVVVSGLLEPWDSLVINGVKDTVKLLVVLAAGVDHVDIDAATRAGIAVANTPGKNSTAVAEVALAFMLDLTRNITRFDRKLREGMCKEKIISRELSGKTVGMIGFGAVAKKLIILLKGFSCRIIVVSHDPKRDHEEAVSMGVEIVKIEQLLNRADFITLHVPLTCKTEGMVDISLLRRMKPAAYLINTSRHGLIKEKDLIYALKNNIISGAALDVYENEPFSPCEKLRLLDNVIINPHSASLACEAIERVLEAGVQSVVDFYNGNEIESLLNPEYINAYHFELEKKGK